MAGSPPPPRDALAAALRRAMHRASTGELVPVPPRVRFELRRKMLHVAVAIAAVPALIVVPFWVMVGLALTGIVTISLTWAIERRRLPPELKGPLHEPMAEVLNKTRREGEDFPWSPVLYTASLIIIGLAHEYFGFSWALAFAAYAILGIGDAASALVGVAYGRTKLAWNRKKSIEGTFAGLVAGYFAGVVLGAVPYGLAAMLVPPAFLFVVFAGAVAGALAETIPRVEDNFVVPISAAAAMWLVAAAPRPTRRGRGKRAREKWARGGPGSGPGTTRPAPPEPQPCPRASASASARPSPRPAPARARFRARPEPVVPSPSLPRPSFAAGEA